eukprot:3582188-Alexandrium_andersonii.AAC.1
MLELRDPMPELRNPMLAHSRRPAAMVTAWPRRRSAALVLAALPGAAQVPWCTGAGCARAAAPTPAALVP